MMTFPAFPAFPRAFSRFSMNRCWIMCCFHSHVCSGLSTYFMGLMTLLLSLGLTTIQFSFSLNMKRYSGSRTHLKRPTSQVDVDATGVDFYIQYAPHSDKKDPPLAFRVAWVMEIFTRQVCGSQHSETKWDRRTGVGISGKHVYRYQ